MPVPAPENAQNGAERGARGDAERVGGGQRVGEQRLKGGARHGESGARDDREQHARQAHVENDVLHHAVRFDGRPAVGQQHAEHFASRKAEAPEAEREKGRGDEKRGKQGDEETKAARRPPGRPGRFARGR